MQKSIGLRIAARLIIRKPMAVRKGPLATLLVGLAVALLPSLASATTFNLATLNDYVTGTGNRRTNVWYDGTNTTGTLIFNKNVAQQSPWTQALGLPDQASINFAVPGMGNNSGKVYMSAGALFPIPTGQALGLNQSGYSGDFSQYNGFPLYFAFSNPTYDGVGGTITPASVTLNSLYLTGGAVTTITGYSDLGQTAKYTESVTVPGTGADSPQKIVLNWTGVEYVSLSGAGFYVNDIQVNDPVPEPATLSLLALGGLAMLRRKRK